MKLWRDSLYSLLGTLGPVAIAILTTPFLLATIGAERYGALAIVWLLLGYFGQADFGIGRAVTQRIAQMGDIAAQARATTVWSAFLTILLFGVVSGVVALACSHWFFADAFKADADIRDELRVSIGLIAVCAPVIAFFGVASGCLQGAHLFNYSSFATFVSNVGLQLFPLIVAVAYTDHLQALIAASLAGRTLGLVIALAGVWLHFLKRNRFKIAGKEMLFLVNFGRWIMVSAVVGPLMIIADRFVIGGLLGAVAVAAYTVPFQVASRTLLFPLAIIQVLFPRLAAMSADEAREACQKYTVLIAHLMLPLIIVLICLADPLLHLWLGESLDPESVLIARIILAGFWINGIANVPYSYLQARGNSRFVAILHLCELPIYIALLFSLGEAFGLMGIATAFAVRCLLDFLGLLAGSRIGTVPFMSRLFLQAVLMLASILLHEWQTGWAASLAFAAVFGGVAMYQAVRTTPAEFWAVVRLRLQGSSRLY